ncbi:MAG TPA: glutaredoxin family protein [Pseudomonadota bacterium]|nr:glutaredoxin family protein [Pseudomonadota bacterium]
MDLALARPCGSAHFRERLMKFASAAFILCAGLLGTVAGYGVARWLPPMQDRAETMSGNFSEHFDVASPGLILYSTSTCPWCKKMRAWLDSHDLRYEDRVIDRNPALNRRFRRLRQPGVPVLISSERLLDHYDEALLSEWLQGPRQEFPRVGGSPRPR